MRILTLLLLLPALSFAQVPNTFQNGDVADADKINENFEVLDQRLQSLEVPAARDSLGQLNMDVDCSSDSGALAAMIQATAHLDPVNFNISGDCQFEGGFVPRGRQVSISGGGAEVRPRLLMGDAFFQAKNSGIDFYDLDIEVGPLFNLSQNASVTLGRVNFLGPAATTISVRPNSNLRLQDSLQTEVRPTINLTAGTLWVRSVFAPTKLGQVSATIGSRVWCRICNVDIPSLILDINSSLCASEAYDELPNDGNSNPAHLNLGELTVQAGSVFIHEGAPSAEPTYSANVSSGAIAEWNVEGSISRCLNR